MTMLAECEVVTQIGATAGEVWHVLDDAGALTVNQIVKRVSAPRDLVLQAVGWLAREEKIVIEERGRSRLISLLC